MENKFMTDLKEVNNFTLTENGAITTVQAAELLGIKQRRARDILAKMIGKKWIKKELSGILFM